MSRPHIEFADGRPPVELTAAQTIIGRGAAANLRVDAAGVADQHARIVLDAKSGRYWIEDMKTKTGTLRNGERMAAKQWLSERDRIEVGAATLTFKVAVDETAVASPRGRAAAAPAPAPAAAAPKPAAPAFDGGEDNRTVVE